MELITLYNKNDRELLLQTAKDSIAYGIAHHKALPLNVQNYPPQLCQPRACFVTLHLDKQLRGCIGTLEAHQPLILDVAANAYNAAFNDPRFAPVHANEVPQITLDISVLSPPQPMQFNSEADLLRQIRPGIDGLILSDQGRRGTFLPSVWEQLPDPVDFLKHLKNKAGFPADYWSQTLKVESYTAELIS